MYRVNQSDQSQKKKNPIVGIALFIVSIVLSIVTLPIGLLYGTLHSLLKDGFTGLGDYYMEMAIIIDQQGNVIMQHLLNVLWISGEGKYLFGDRDETISSALGKNQVRETLSGFGRLIVVILDKLDPDHSLSSIEYYVQRSNRINNDQELAKLQLTLSRRFENVDFSGIIIHDPITHS